jgi:hypothetical protein
VKKRIRRTRGYTVGISVFVNANGDLGLWENGLRQNVFFLYELFRAAPNCAKVYLLNHGDGDPTAMPDGLDFPLDAIVKTPDVMADLDYVIVIGAAIDPTTLVMLREQGTKIISYRGGNGAVLSIESIIDEKRRPQAERYFDVGLFDAVWMTPQHIHTYKPWIQTIYRLPVSEVPQIWSPTFLDCRQVSKDGLFGYQPGKDKWRVGMMDPNITVMKTSHMGMLACEVAYRERPGMFKSIYVSNASQLMDHPHFSSFASSMSAAKAGIMTVEPRFISADFLANHCDAIVTHHWENGLNYVYYDVLHGNYPLIHNSSFLKDYGYYYPDWSPDIGGKVLIDAFDRHDKELPAYQAKCRELIARVAPTHPDNIALHERLLTAPIVTL